jgi:hypothetical protein
MTATLNREQAAALAHLLNTHTPAGFTAEDGPNGVRYVTLEGVRYRLDPDGEIQGAVPS